jgi:DNA-binding MarR family transcriptional regulator
MSITRLTRSTALPATTVLRRLGLLEKEGLVTRAGDPFDARRVFVTLSPAGIEAMDRCFAASGLRVALL